MIVSFHNRESNNRENLSPRGLASLIAKRQRSGDDARCLLAPIPINLNTDEGTLPSQAATRLSKTSKNHLLANRKALKEKQNCNKQAALEEQRLEDKKLKLLEQKKIKLFGNIKSRVFETTGSSSDSSSNLNNCPSTSTSQQTAESGRLLPSSPLRSSNDATSNNPTFHIAFGRKVASSPMKLCEQHSSNQTGQTNPGTIVERHKSYGKVPSYITNRRAKIERAELERQQLERNAPPAPGLVLMEESERLETLRVLEENEKKEREALSNIPFSMNGHRAARVREAIEFRLREIEDAKRIFSKDRVFVAKDEN